MKKIIYIVLAGILLSFTGCRKHLYHTKYGTFDIDTMKIQAYDREDNGYYLIKTCPIEIKDTANNPFDFTEATIYTYFCPETGWYFNRVISNTGISNKDLYFNPETGEEKFVSIYDVYNK